MDSNAHFACVFGQPSKDKYHSSSIHGAPEQLIVIDLKKGKLLCECPSAGWTLAALVDEKQVVWMSDGANVLKRLKFDGSDTPDEFEFENQVVEMFSLGPDHLGLLNMPSGSRGAGRLAIHDRDTLAKVDSHELSDVPLRWLRGQKSIIHLGDSMIYFRDRVMDQDTGATRCFTAKGRYPAQLGEAKRDIRMQSLEFFGNAFWRRRIENVNVKEYAGTGGFRLNSQNAWLSQTHPLIATLQRTRKSGVELINVEFRELVHGQVLGTMELSNPARFQAGHLSHQSAFRVESNTVVVAVWDEVYIAELPSRYSDDAVMEPLRLQYPIVPIVDLAQPLNFQLAAKGGEKPYRFELVGEEPGVTIANDTGTVSVDFAMGWDKFAKLVSENRHPYYHGSRNGMHINNMRTTEYLGVESKQGEFLVSLPVQFVVTDQSGQSSKILVSLLANASLDEYENLGRDESSKGWSIWNFFGK